MASTDNGTMTLGQARKIAAQAVMRLGSYDPASASDVMRLDSAIKAAGDEFSMHLFPQRKQWIYSFPKNSRFVSFKDASSAPAWVSGSDYTIGDLVQSGGYGWEAFVSLTDNTVAPENDPKSWGRVVVPPSDFSCRRVRWAELIDPRNGKRLRENLVDVETVKQYIWRSFGLVYSPNLVLPSAVGSAFFVEGLTAFDQENDQQWFYPVYTADMMQALHYWVPFSSWTLGATDAPTLATVMNIPDTMIYGVLYYLVPQFYDLAQASNDYIKTCQAKMKEHYSFCTRALKGSSVQYGLPTIYGRSGSGGGTI